MIITDQELSDLATEFGSNLRFRDLDEVTYLIADDMVVYRLERGETSGTAGRLQVRPEWFDEIRDAVMAPIEIGDKNPVMPNDDVIAELASASLGFGLNPSHIDWDRFYKSLEADQRLDMQDLGGKLDDKIRRRANKLRKEGKVEW